MGWVWVASIQGPQGPQGPAGTSYTHTQSASASTWIVTHNLNKKVHVSIFDDTGELIYADVDHGSLNQTTITFSSPMTGTAFFS